MRIVFLGTGEIAIPTFRSLLASSHEVLTLVTQPDKPVGRRSQPQPPAIKVIAAEAGIPVLQPQKIRSPEALAQLADLAPEIIVVMAYGQILPQKLIEIPGKAIINLHASLLPKYRGASCLQAAIINGDQTTGWTVMHVVKALDAGDIIEQQSLDLAPAETGETLHERLAQAGPISLLSALNHLEQGIATQTPQDEDQMSYAPKLEREDGRLDWTRPAAELERKIRAYHSWPGTFTTFVDGKGKQKRLKVFPPTTCSENQSTPGQLIEQDGALLVACGTGALRLELIQPEGSKPMSGGDFLRGVSITALGQ